MLDLQLLLAFTTAAWLSIMTPGPAALLAMRNGASHGVGASLWSTLGNAVGLTLVSAVAASGVGLVLQASSHAMTVVKVVGAMYLAYLGIQMLRKPQTAPLQVLGSSPHGHRFALAREGFLVAVSNPKAILFFTALFPQFVRGDRPLLPQFVLLTAIFVMLSVTTLSLYSAGAAWAKGAALSTRWRRASRCTAGLGFIGFAAWLLLWRPVASGKSSG